MAQAGKKMGLTGLTTLVAVNMMGSGIIMLPSSMAQLGAVSLLSWVVTAIGSMAIAQLLWIVSVGRIGIGAASMHMNAVPFYVMLMVFVMGGPWNW